MGLSTATIVHDHTAEPASMGLVDEVLDVAVAELAREAWEYRNNRRGRCEDAFNLDIMDPVNSDLASVLKTNQGSLSRVVVSVAVARINDFAIESLQVTIQQIGSGHIHSLLGIGGLYV